MLKRSETPEQAEAFEQYLRMPKRSLRRLAGQVGRAHSTVAKWSKDGQWIDRAEQRDRVAAAVAEERWLEEVRARRRQKRVVGEKLLAVALKALSQKQPPQLKPSDIIRYVGLGDALLDEVVDETELTDPRHIETLVRDYAEAEGFDVDDALMDSAAFDDAAGTTP